MRSIKKILKQKSLLVKVAATLLLTKMYNNESFIATLILSIPEFWDSLYSDSTTLDNATKAEYSRQKRLQVVIPFLITFFLLLLLQPKNFDALLLKILISKSEVILQYVFEILNKTSKKRLRKYFRNRK